MKKRLKILLFSCLLIGSTAFFRVSKADHCVNCSMTFTGICVYYDQNNQRCESSSGLMNCCGTFVELQQ